VFLGDNVINLEWQQAVVNPHTAVFAAITCSFDDEAA
jgi:hypothetical protein